jgi:selenide,water dikinase
MNEQEKIKLTQFSRGAGCGCKIAPAVLQQILQQNETSYFTEKLLVGNQSNDDAAVFEIDENNAIISTTDFFMPIVDDAFDFGQIAAANAISDVYAMGGTPLMAVAILGWPIEKLPAMLAQQVLEGARKICKEAGIPLAGGHTIDTVEPMFGLAVTGMVKKARLKRNNTARAGDLLLLTKPIGVGILATAQKRGVIQDGHEAEMIRQMTRLNNIGAELSAIDGVHAMTDITGFGLLGHTIEMAQSSGLTAALNYSKIPVVSGAREYLSQRIVPDATFRNWNSYSNDTSFEKGVNVMEAFSLLPDPQTNGGLLISVSEEALEKIKELFVKNGYADCIEPIGKMLEKQEKTVSVNHH